MHFRNLAYRFPEDESDWEFLDGRFEYLLYISENMQFLKSFEPRSTYSCDGAAQSHAGTIAVTSDCPPSPHQTTPPPQGDVREMHTHPLNDHILLPHLLLISAQIWLVSLLVITWIRSLNLRPRVPLIL